MHEVIRLYLHPSLQSRAAETKGDEATDDVSDERRGGGARYDPRLLKSPSNFISVSNEEDDVISHHDLVVILHAGQSATHLGLCKRILTLLVDVVHQRAHLH